MVEKILNGLGGDQEDILTVYREVWRVQDRSKRKNRRRARLALRNKVNEEKHLEMYGKLRKIYGMKKKNIGMKTYLHGPMDYAKKLKLRFRVGDLDPPERRMSYTSRREEGMDAHMCPCGIIIEYDSHSRRM